jgi:hypothetical protein
MIRTIADTATDLDIMEHAVKRMSEVIYISAKSYFRDRYDDALARVETDLGDDFRIMRGMKLEPEDLIRLGRQQVSSLSQSRDVPQTPPPGGPW